ncbi:MAG: AAA family ATPase [Candidatus Pacebacteria bacterium]|nr:AAA family ATPase [Candidatus Paceibacterota bacterium]
MKLEEVQIENYRCFENLTVKLHPRLNVIVGANGAGKSSLLEAICYAFAPIAITLHRELSGIDYSMKFIDHKNSSVPETHEISVPVGLQIPSLKDYYIYYNGNIIKKINIKLKIQHSPEITTEVVSELNNSNLSIIDFYAGNFLTDTSLTTILPLFSYYRAFRYAPSQANLGDPMNTVEYKTSAIQNLFRCNATYHEGLRWFYNKEGIEFREKDQNKSIPDYQNNVLKNVRKAICDTLPYVKRIYFVVSNVSAPEFYIDFENDDGVIKSMRLSQLSDGYLNIISIIMDYARRLSLFNPTMDNPLDAEGILLIDEIELHLHPKWQQRVLIDLQRVFPNTQIIVTTHSAAVLSTVHRDNIILLTEDHQVESLPDDFGSYGAESSKLLAQVFGVDNRAAVELKIGEKKVPINETISRYLRLIEDEKHDCDEAKILRELLEKSLGKKDPFFVTADMRIKQIPFLKGLKNAKN